ncbi:MAG: DNA adenine methylase [Spirochaetaceae bacterium]|jgi:DNA adenine methylase|nr:DNA adenine methylase [Spirochaetaceae bacterium]
MCDSCLKPFLKWAGGKRQLLPEITKRLPRDIQNYTYYEPFLGAGAVFFSLQPKKAVINDCNRQLIMTYRVIKEQREEVITLLREYQQKNAEAYYYQIRNLDRDQEAFAKMTDVEKAARLIFLNKTCYNGLYRVNAHGLFNAPYGKYKNPAICEETLLRHIGEYLISNDIAIANEDFEAVLADIEKPGFIYFDPPYHSPDKKNFTGYQAERFDEAEQERLRDAFAKAADSGAQCLLSNADTPFIRKLYKRFTIHSVQAKRAINSNAAGRGLVGEVLVQSW